MLQGKKTPDKIVIYEALSDRYGWLPSEIDDEDYFTLTNYLHIVSIKNLLEKAEQRKHK